MMMAVSEAFQVAVLFVETTLSPFVLRLRSLMSKSPGVLGIS